MSEAVIWDLNEKELVRISVEEFERRFEDLYKEYEGLLRTTVHRLFPRNVCSSGNGLLQDYDDLMQVARYALFYAQTHYHVTQAEKIERKKKNGEEVDWNYVTIEKKVKETKASFASYLITAVRGELINLYNSQRLRKLSKVGTKKGEVSVEKHEKEILEDQVTTSYVSMNDLPERELEKLQCHRKVKNPAAAFNETNLLETALSSLNEVEKTAFQMLYEGWTIQNIKEKIGSLVQQDFYNWISGVKAKIRENKQLCLLLGKV